MTTAANNELRPDVDWTRGKRLDHLPHWVNPPGADLLATTSPTRRFRCGRPPRYLPGCAPPTDDLVTAPPPQLCDRVPHGSRSHRSAGASAREAPLRAMRRGAVAGDTSRSSTRRTAMWFALVNLRCWPRRRQTWAASGHRAAYARPLRQTWLVLRARLYRHRCRQRTETRHRSAP